MNHSNLGVHIRTTTLATMSGTDRHRTCGGGTITPSGVLVYKSGWVWNVLSVGLIVTTAIMLWYPPALRAVVAWF